MSVTPNQDAIREVVQWFVEQPDHRRSTLMDYWGIRQERCPTSDPAHWFGAAMQRVKDVAWRKHGLCIIPVYCRDGWWTAQPGRYVQLEYLIQTYMATLSRVERNARLTDPAGRMNARGTEAMLRSQRNLVLAEIAELTPDEDPCVIRIDRLVQEVVA